MSAVPEAKLAREAEIAYQMICMSTDYDCWHDTEDVNVAMVMETMRANSANAKLFITAVLDELSKAENEEQVSAKHLAEQTKIGVSTDKAGWNKDVVEKLNWLFPGYFSMD